MRLGTWTTIDCPTQNIDEALKYLKEEFEKIGGKVRMEYNDHDLGTYPSFEIDKPSELIECDEIHDLCTDCDDYTRFTEKANLIEDEYCKKFNDYL